MTASGRKLVRAISEGKIRFSPRSKRKTQSEAPSSSESESSGLRGGHLVGLAPGLVKVIYGRLEVSVEVCRWEFQAVRMADFSTDRTELCLQVYLPWRRAVGQAVRICLNVHVPPHRRQEGSTLETPQTSQVVWCGEGVGGRVEKESEDTIRCPIC